MTTLFACHRRLLALAVLLIIVAGLSAYQVLPRAEDPTLIARVATIITCFPGASAKRVEALVTEKIEDELADIEELRTIASISRAGVSVITVEQHDHVTAVDEVWSRVRDKLADAEAEMPAGAGDPEFDEQEVTAFSVIAALVWDLDSPVSYAVLRRLGKQLEDRLRTLPGTAEVELFGDPEEEVRVEISSTQLAALQLSMLDVANAMRNADAKVAAGQLHHAGQELLVEVDGEVESLARVEDIVIRQGPGGQFVRVGDVARVRKTVVDPQAALAIVDDQPAVLVAARMADANRIDQWAEEAREVIGRFDEELPSGIGVQLIFDQSRYVVARLGNLQANLLLGIGAVVLVIVFTMGWRSAVLVGAALPLSSLMVLAGMQMLGIPLNQMSVTGLIIALGLLIDNAIVIVDEVRHRLGGNEGPIAAVDRAVRHLFVPLAASTFTTALSFLPIVLMPGPAGEFVGSIALSVILAIASSFLLAMTVIPALTAWLDGGARRAAGTGGLLAVGFRSVRLTAWYRRSLDAVFARPLLGVIAGLVLPVVGFVGAAGLEEQFFPRSDRDQFQVALYLPEHASLERTETAVRDLREVLLAHPRVTAVHAVYGTGVPKFYYNMIGGQDGSPFYAQALVQIDGSADIERVIREVQDLVDHQLPAGQALVRQLAQGPPFQAPIEMRIYGPDLDQLHVLGEHLRRELAAVDDVLHTRATLSDGRPKLRVNLDEDEARMAGLDNVAVAQQLAAHLSGVTGGSLLEDTEELPLRARLVPEDRTQVAPIETVNLITGRTAEGASGYLPLAAVGALSVVPERSSVPRRNGQRVNAVQGFITAGVLPATVLARFEQRLTAVGMVVPPGYHLEIGGESAERDRAVGNLMASVGVIATVMLTTLVLVFNSFRMAGILALVATLSIGLGLAGLVVFGHPFGFMAIVGTMGLVGVAINDTIVVLAAIREDDASRTGDRIAIRNVVMRASRHVISTTVTTVAGFLPLLISGGDFWPPLVTAIAGGVVGATVLSLYFAPALYCLWIARAPITARAGARARRLSDVAELAPELSVVTA